MFKDPFQTPQDLSSKGLALESSPRDEPEVMLDINTTPLIDVLLVLIIMLIITIPAQLHSVNMDMPVAVPLQKKLQPQVIKIAIDGKNTVSWNGKELSPHQDLELLFDQASQLDPKPEIHIRAQAKTSYGTLMKVMAGAQRHGLNKIGVLGAEMFTPQPH